MHPGFRGGLLHGPVLELSPPTKTLGFGVGGAVVQSSVRKAAPGSNVQPGTLVAVKKSTPTEILVCAMLKPCPVLATPLQVTRGAQLVTVDGGHGTLATLLAHQFAGLSVGRAPRVYAVMAMDLLSALRALAAVGVAHNDLKPENVLVRELEPGVCGGPPVPRLALVDFGAAVLVDPCECCKSAAPPRARPPGETGPSGFMPGFPRTYASGEAPLWPGNGFSALAAAAWGAGMLLACVLAGERDVVMPEVGVPHGEEDPWDTGATRIKTRMAAYLRGAFPTETFGEGASPDARLDARLDAAQAGVLCLWPTIAVKWVVDCAAEGFAGAMANAHTLGAVRLVTRLLLAGLTPGPTPCPLAAAMNDPWLQAAVRVS